MLDLIYFYQIKKQTNAVEVDGIQTKRASTATLQNLTQLEQQTEPMSDTGLYKTGL